ncbi:PQQ-binding-like beta-propeller repeat protein [Thauera humireducens]|uniref:outer membrane protein assembly factor BamB family protein n=1 Tax=Thauera humireducens TaxID=1134435 RepID=UPI00311D4894
MPVTLQDDKSWSGPRDNKPGQPMSGVGWNTAKLVNAEAPKAPAYGRLLAWDPVAQKEVWRQEYVSPWNGGTLATAGNVVFQGTADARFIAYDARDGKKLWDTATGSGVIAAPITYEVDGEQYVSVAVGWGGVYGQARAARTSSRQARCIPSSSAAPRRCPSRWPTSSAISCRACPTIRQTWPRAHCCT